MIPRAKTYKLVPALLCLAFDATLLVALIWLNSSSHRFPPSPLWLKVSLIVVLVLISNTASAYLIGWYKDNFLWPRAGAYFDDPRKSLHEWWRETRFYSSLASHLGFIERVVVTAAGIVSFQWFFIACGAWLTLKTAVEWNQFSGANPRVISHIYLISSVLSLATAALDVAIIRTLFALPLNV